ncbi:FtsK/SpoIIIE domain-containing protein [Saccharopolyspora griseoalba]|uniref:FtsK/SpoIIIE domain-containing protein n=1 Tax=Saccharopolyspora griseoalba TaxID=1431848 RepID=A0ABW2LUK2_9PSEU
MSGQRNSSGRRSGRHDLFEELFGKGALTRSDSPSSRSTKTTPAPAWARWLTLAVVTGVVAGVVHGWALPRLPAGGSRDQLRAWLRLGVEWAPWAVAGCAAAAVISGVFAWRSAQRAREDKQAEERKKAPSGADRAAAAAVKLPIGSVQVTPHYRWWHRSAVRQVVVRAPAGAVLEDPSRAWCTAIGTVLGVELAPRSWEVARGRAVLEPGTLPPEPVEVLPPTATTPVARAEQALSSLLGRQGQLVESDVVDTHDDGAPREFTVRHAPSAKLATAERRELFAELLSGMLPESSSGRGWDVLPDPTQDRVRIVERPPLEKLIPRPVFDERAYFQGRDVLAIGQDEHGNAVGWDCSSSTLSPHGLAVGPTGLGKTNLLRNIIASGSRLDFQTRIADPKRIEFLGVSEWPGVTKVARDVDAIRGLIVDAHDEMDRRYTHLERRKDPRDLQPLLVLLDEWYIMRTLLEFEHRKEGGKGSPVELQLVARVMAMARTARLHLLLGIQRPDAENFPDGARDNAQFRVSLGPLSPQGAGMIWPGHTRTATSVPRMHGRGLISDQHGNPTSLQAWWIPNLDGHTDARARLQPQDRALLDALRPGGPVGAGWTQHTDTPLVVPSTPAHTGSGSAGARRDAPAEPAAGSAEAALDGVADVIRARDLLDHMRIRIEDNTGALVDATVEHTDSPTDEVMIADLMLDGGQPLQREFDGGDEVWLLDESTVHA